MALNIEFEGFTQAPKVLSWGTVVTVAHSQRAKNDAGEWTTVGKDYIDVTVPEGVQAPAEGVLVKVKGTLTVRTYDKADGTTGVGLKVRAQEISEIFRDRDPVAVVRDVLGDTVNLDMPF